MEMDGLDSAKCQKSKRRDTYGIIKLLMNKTKTCIVLSSSNLRSKCGEEPEIGSSLAGLSFSERGSGFSLGFRLIGPSVFDGARRKFALHGEDYAWAPIWWSSENSKR